MNEIYTDGRFDLIAAYKRKLIESTNIETSHEEMAVIDNVLFRFWQMGWLPPLPHGRLIDADALEDKCRRLAMDKWNKSTGTTWGYAYATFGDDVENAPTIIEAEGEE